ncbi:MAG: hypothetical protein M1813_008883 [Trichoglossum hirsutum]|nr:MAG: hypothetical protein M1813_008883 [Trichoglossum hirsutum]
MFVTQTAPSFLPRDSSNAKTTAKSNFTETTVHYIEEKAARDPTDSKREKHSYTSFDDNSSPRRRKPVVMNGHTGVAPPPGMYVRALYDYEADDQTSLSFHQGDIIQVITQLDSGWWDGVINGVRGWFPSNYCALVTGPDDDGRGGRQPGDADDADGELEDEDEFEEDYEEDDLDSEGNPRDGSTQLPLEGTDGQDQEEAAFWIPQATPDGRLFYFNTLTGVSTMELPLESPNSATETGPLDRNNVHAPEQTRLPAEMMSRGYERDEEDFDYDEGNSASEREGESLMLASQGSLEPSHRSFVSDGVSPATSMNSITSFSPVTRSRNDTGDSYFDPNISMTALQTGTSIQPLGANVSSFTNNPLAQPPSAAIPGSFFDDGAAVPLTWDRLVEDMRISIESYRQAISNGDRAEYVRRAEDISDHVRLLLAAGSGTTDNHSGAPSIISTNKALYPHFRDMMSRFSKLVLSSHIATADWPSADSYSKCLQEADAVLHGVYGYVEVARQQRGEDIPRLIPGFVVGSTTGGNWRNNGLGPRDPMSSTFIDQDDYESTIEPTGPLDPSLLERLDELKRMISTNIRRLDEQLVISDRVVTAQKHEAISDAVCSAARRVIDCFRPYLAAVESTNLAPLGSSPQNPQLVDFATQKQRLYDSISDLMLGCQAVASPLGDEWAAVRGDPLDGRLNSLRIIAKQLESCTMHLSFSLQLLQEMVPREDPKSSRDGTYPPRPHQRPQSRQARVFTEDRPSIMEGIDPATGNYRKGENSKVKKFFGEEPAPSMPPWFLRLDHETEISYDMKTNPPQLRGGTMVGLVEQLTRHDRLDSPFNNTFLLTYRSFTTASELFDMLVKRFSIQPPSGLNPEEYQVWVDKKQKPIRFRVVNILKSWFDNYWMEGQDESSKDLIRRVHAFAKDSVETTGTPGAQPLMTVVEQRLRGQDSNTKRLVLTLSTSAPAPIIPRNMRKLKFLDIDTTEFARQLTIIESKLYGKIKPTECLNKTWNKKEHSEDGAEPAENVKALILHSNQLTNWVAEMILTQSDVKRRVMVIKHFISVAEKCRSLNNFSTLTSIISTFSTAPIHRLKRTWEAVPTRTQSVLESMRTLMGSTKNFGEYRETLRQANPPCIPFFGVYLTDLTFIEDGIPSVIKKTNLINFAKRAKTAEVIRDIQQYQNVPYPLQPVPELQEYILSSMQAAGDVHEMYDKSLTVEPREREDEKIARYF